MKQRESTFLNMVGALLAVTLLSGALLGFVHRMTSDAIEISRVKAQADAIASVLPEFELVKPSVKVLPDSGSDSLEVFPAYKGDKLVGLAVKSYSNKGFNGYISVMVGIDTLGNYTGYEVLEHKETPGLGSKMTEWFRNPEKERQNIIGKNPGKGKLEVSKDGGDVDAITASTITSRAFLDALNRAHAGFGIFSGTAAPDRIQPAQ